MSALLCGQSPPASLVADIARRFDDPRFAHAHWGVLIQSLKTGEVWYERNADRFFMPASNQKILTGAAALIGLGPDFRFETRYLRDGPIRDGVLEGSLICVGDGDPTFYTRFFDDPRTVFRQLAKTLKEQGVSRIRGDVIGDDDAFEEPTWGFGVTLEDLPHYYAAKVGALQLDENYIDIRVVAPKEAGAPVRLEPRLPTRYFEIENAVVVTDKGASWVEVSRDPGSRRVRVFGRVKPGDPTREVAPSVPDPTAFYLTVLVEVLEEAGIVVEGRAVDADDIEGWQSGAPKAAAVMSHRSPPLSAILKLFLERSQNLYGETLVRAMGRQRFREGSFLAGRRAVQATLGDLGLSSDQYLFTDGSGLSRYDYVSPRALVHVLKAMRGHEYSRVFEDALPLAGREGTLARRMKGTVAEGNVNAKTGTISNVRALSGYVTTADGEPLVFSFLVNGHARSNAETEEITDGVLVVLAGLDRGR